MQIRNSVSHTLEQREADVVLVVHRLDESEPEGVRRRVHSSPNVMTGITSASQPGRLESLAELLSSGAGQAEFSGKVGDCCDEEDVTSQVLPHPTALPLS